MTVAPLEGSAGLQTRCIADVHVRIFEGGKWPIYHATRDCARSSRPHRDERVFEQSAKIDKQQTPAALKGHGLQSLP